MPTEKRTISFSDVAKETNVLFCGSSVLSDELPPLEVIIIKPLTIYQTHGRNPCSGALKIGLV